MKGRRKLMIRGPGYPGGGRGDLFAGVVGDPACQNLLRLQGHLEATETDLSFKVSGLIEYIFFQEGDWVKSGQKTAGLEAKDLKDEVDRARAGMASAKANLAKLEAGYRSQEIKEAEAQVGKTKADLVNKKIDFERYENLHRRKVVAGITGTNSRPITSWPKRTTRAPWRNTACAGKATGWRTSTRPGRIMKPRWRPWSWPKPGWATPPSPPGERRGPGAPHGTGRDRGRGLPGGYPGGPGQHLF